VASPAPLGDRRLRVLIVDDDQRYVEALTATLASEPELDVVAAARDGVEALELAQQLAPLDIILRDIEMPRMNGLETLRALRKAKEPAAVVMLTGATDHDVIGQARRQGPDGFLLKSLDPDEIVNGILIIGHLFRSVRP
jgi:two-component system nitrate/nitrite response regulator NarL